MQIIIIDMLEGFTRLGPLASPRVNALVPRQAALIRNLPPDSLVVFVGDEHDPRDPEMSQFPPHCLSGTPQADFRHELLDAAQAAHARTEILRKHTLSCFLDTGLDQVVQNAPSLNWFVCGCVTDICVETCVAELRFRRRKVTLVRDLIDTWDLTPEQAAAQGLGPEHVHPADEINRFWFEKRFPAVWGACVLNTWQQAIRHPQ